jgi:hypothetical protein
MHRIKPLERRRILPPRPLLQSIRNEVVPQSGDVSNIIFQHNPSSGRATQVNMNIPCTMQGVKPTQERGRITLATTKGQQITFPCGTSKILLRSAPCTGQKSLAYPTATLRPKKACFDWISGGVPISTSGAGLRHHSIRVCS